MSTAESPSRFRLPDLPLWLFGVFEAVQAVLALALLVTVPVLAMALGSAGAGFDGGAVTSLSAQVWLVLNASPLQLTEESGWFRLVPLGLTLIPFYLAWRAGRRLAQGSYPDQLWQGLTGFILVYAAAAGGIAQLAQGSTITAAPPASVAAAAAVAALGSLSGCYAEARSATRMIGVDLEAKVEELSQHLKWAGAYLWAVLRAGAVAAVAAVGLSALLLGGWIGFRWMDVANAYQAIGPGIWGAAGLTLLQLGAAPNMVLWALSYSTGAGFSVGSGTQLSPFAAELGAVPDVPVLAVLPAEVYEYSWTVLGLPLLAGVLAGWWLMREGENHLDDWFVLRIRFRPVSLTLSTLTLGLLTGLVTALLAVLPLWLSHISLGLGRMSDIGPHALLAAVMLGGWVAAGTVLGYLIAPATSLKRRRRLVPDETETDEAETSEDEHGSPRRFKKLKNDGAGPDHARTDDEAESFTASKQR
ncbi:DUF6350 family protein [Nesterenkonia massiliensis]|uniref:DUF6350 family protein n=1 Tax=Nesterenkonia massiliensis TaxID=1232429 RepID=A0ABT2HQJ5_9MICC|nr:DUF6350 family protein [Nesterenkonia massiliensis]MCT1606968.1 DUF6350 family protein [Nesterenkonia massiliensis]